MKLSTTNGLAVADYFTPFDQAARAAADTTSARPAQCLLPDSAGSAAHPHLLVGLDKGGKVFVLDRDTLASPNYQTSDSTARLCSISPHHGNGIFSSPTYFNGMIYVQPVSSAMQQLSITNGPINTTPRYDHAGVIWQFKRRAGRLRQRHQQRHRLGHQQRRQSGRALRFQRHEHLADALQLQPARNARPARQLGEIHHAHRRRRQGVCARAIRALRLWRAGLPRRAGYFAEWRQLSSTPPTSPSPMPARALRFTTRSTAQRPRRVRRFTPVRSRSRATPSFRPSPLPPAR